MVNYVGTPNADFWRGTIDPDTANGGDGNDMLEGGDGADTIDGGNGDDFLFSYLDTSSLWSNPPNYAASGDFGLEHDTLLGGAGDDQLVVGWGDTVNGGTGYNTLWISFFAATSGVVADFRIVGAGGSITINGGTISNISEVMSIDGSNFDDTIYSIGTLTFAGIIRGFGGNDHIVGSEITKFIQGGDGNDWLDAKALPCAQTACPVTRATIPSSPIRTIPMSGRLAAEATIRSMQAEMPMAGQATI